MTFDQLEHFIVLANVRNFSKAAEMLFMEQPTLSRQIKMLENDLGVELFKRGHRELTLTEAGHKFLNYANHIIHETKAVRRDIHERTQSLKIMLLAEFFDIFLDMFTEFKQQNPDIILDLNEYESERLMALSRQKGGDFIFGWQSFGEIEGYNRLIYQRINMMAAVPCDSELAKKEIIHIKDLQDQRFVFYDRPRQTEMFISYCNSNGFHPQIQSYVSRYGTMTALILTEGLVGFAPAGIDRVGFIPSDAKEDSKPFGYQTVYDRVSLIPLDPPIRDYLSIDYKKGLLNDASSRFLDYLRERIKTFDLPQ